MASDNLVLRNVMLDETTHAFLSAAIDFHRVAYELHQGHSPNVDSAARQHGLEDRARRLREVVQHILAKPTSADDLDAACRMVGRDLGIKLQRLGILGQEPCDPKDVAVQLRNVWPLVDILALGQRLDDMAQAWYTNTKTSTRALPPLLVVRPPEEASSLVEYGEEHLETPPIHQGSHVNRGSSDSGELGSQNPVSVFDQRVTEVKKPAGQRLASSVIVTDFILESLAYKSMYDREEEISAAHEKTFDWVFRSDCGAARGLEFRHQLTTWLTTNDLGPIYWITGKPGSGKSTLVRYLSRHEQVDKSLRIWADGKPILQAGFFFWTSGSREQRSQTGLLRSLLHQLLSAHPDSMQYTFPELWHDLRVMSTKDRINLQVEWTVEKLMKGFGSFMDAVLPTDKVCLFIDGLDEFDGDHATIIEFFKRLALRKGGHQVKLCLSSRPWRVFEEAFEDAVPNLKLQDLTHDDMYSYARDMLCRNPHFESEMRGSSSTAEDILRQIVQQADGVFLWTRLAVGRLWRDFAPMEASQSFHLSQLAATLQTLPTEIDDLFFKLLFEEQSDSEVAISALIFQLIKAQEMVADRVRDESSNSLTVWEMAFAISSSDDKVVLGIDGVSQASSELIDQRCRHVHQVVVQRASGLLGLFPPRSRDILSSRPPGTTRHRITYVHRTVRDWLMECRGIQPRLKKALEQGFDAHLRLLRSYVLRLKFPLEQPEQHRRLDEWWPDIVLAMTNARYVGDGHADYQRKLLNELNSTLCWYWRRKPSDPYDHWARNAFGSFEERTKAPPIWQPFLCLATKFGLTEYVLKEVEEGNRRWEDGTLSDEEKELMCSKSTPLLSYATEFLCSTQKTIFPLSNVRLVTGLLRNPGPINPGTNHEYVAFYTRATVTVWESVLRHLRDARRRGWIEYYDVDPQGVRRWADIVRLFVELGGADVEAVVKADHWDKEITARNVLKLLDDTYGSWEIVQLVNLLEAKGSVEEEDSARKRFDGV